MAANPVVQNYLNDEGVDYNKRLGVINAIKAGQNPDEIGGMISQKYGNKYSTGVSPVPVSQPTPNPQAASKIGNAVAGGLNALNPANLGSTISGAEQVFGQAAPKIGQVLSAIGKHGGDTPEEAAQGAQASDQREMDRQAQVQKDSTNGQYLSSRGIKYDVSDDSNKLQQDADVQRGYDQAANAGSDLGIGVAKGFGSSVLGAAQLGNQFEQWATSPITDRLRPAVQSVTEPAVSAALGQAPTDQQISQNMQTMKENLTTPDNLAQTIGFGGEQLGEFLLPEAWVTKGVDVADAGLKAAELPGIVQKTGSLATKAGLEGLSAAAVEAAQSGKVDQNTAIMGGIGAAVPVAGAGLKALWDPLSKAIGEQATSQISKLIKPNAKAYLFGKDPAQAIVDEGIKGTSWNNFLENLSSKKTEIGQSLGDNVKAATEKAPAQVDAMNLINKNVQKFGENTTDSATFKAYADKIKQLTGEFKPDLTSGELIQTGTKPLDKLNQDQLWGLQKKIGSLTQWTGASYDKEINQGLHSLYTDIGKELEKTASGTKGLQKRYANLIGAEQAAMARDAVVKRNTSIVSKGIGGALGGALNPVGDVLHSDDPVSKAGSVLLGALAPKLFESPAFRTHFAQLLSSEGIASPALMNTVKAGALAAYSHSKK